MVDESNIFFLYLINNFHLFLKEIFSPKLTDIPNSVVMNHMKPPLSKLSRIVSSLGFSIQDSKRSFSLAEGPETFGERLLYELPFRDTIILGRY